MNTMSRLLVLSASLVCVAAPSLAFATSGFPGVIESTVPTPGPVDCAVCHAGGATRRGTVTTPFGLALRARGLQPKDNASLEAALAALRTEGVDSDMDGVADITELEMGTNPNAAPGQNDLPPIQYGCGQIAIGANTTPGLIVGLLLAGAVLRVARRRK